MGLPETGAFDGQCRLQYLQQQVRSTGGLPGAGKSGCTCQAGDKPRHAGVACCGPHAKQLFSGTAGENWF